MTTICPICRGTMRWINERFVCPVCGYDDTPELKPVTNADRIRAMTDEELMLWLYGYADGSGKTREQWIEWLKEEADK